MRGARAGAIEFGCRRLLDEPRQSAVAVAVNMLPRRQQAGIERGGTAADRADAIDPLAVNLVRPFALMFRVMRPIGDGQATTELPFVTRDDCEVVVERDRGVVDASDDALADKPVRGRVGV